MTPEECLEAIADIIKGVDGPNLRAIYGLATAHCGDTRDLYDFAQDWWHARIDDAPMPPNVRDLMREVAGYAEFRAGLVSRREESQAKPEKPKGLRAVHLSLHTFATLLKTGQHDLRIEGLPKDAQLTRVEVDHFLWRLRMVWESREWEPKPGEPLEEVKLVFQREGVGEDCGMMRGRSILIDAVLDVRGRFADVTPPWWLWERVPGIHFQDRVLRFFQWWQRKFYALKAIVAIVLGHVFQYSPFAHYHLDTVEVGMWGWHRTMTDWGEGADWQTVRVGRGVLKGWWVGWHADGYP